MVRVAGLAQLVRNHMDVVSEDGFTPQTQLRQVVEGSRSLMRDQQRVWSLLLGEMAEQGVARVVSVSDLGPEDRAYLHDKFLNELWPQLTPQSIDNAHPFPFVPNKGMGLALTLTKKEGPKAPPRASAPHSHAAGSSRMARISLGMASRANSMPLRLRPSSE